MCRRENGAKIAYNLNFPALTRERRIMRYSIVRPRPGGHIGFLVPLAWSTCRPAPSEITSLDLGENEFDAFVTDLLHGQDMDSVTMANKPSTGGTDEHHHLNPFQQNNLQESKSSPAIYMTVIINHPHHHQ